MLFEETTGTLLCGDLFTQVGAGPALTTVDIVEPAVAAELMFHQSSFVPNTAQTMRRLGDLDPTTLATCTAASYQGDGREALYDLAVAYEQLIAAA